MRLSTFRFQKWVQDNNIGTLQPEGDSCTYDSNSLVFMLAPNTMYMSNDTNNYYISCISYFEVTEFTGNEYKYIVTVHTRGYHIEDPDSEQTIYLR